MKRDFSRVKIEELQADIIDFTSDYLKDLGKVIDLEDMDIMEKIVFIKAMESFENKLEEKKLVSANKLVEIITNVKELEKTFAEYLGTLNEQLDAYDKRLQSVIEMLKPEKLSMNNLQYMDEMLKIGKAYQNAKENSQLINVEIWLNPNYRMSEDDLVIAQEMLDEYFAEGTEAEKRFFAESEYDWIEEMANDDWTDEEWHRYQLMCALYTKMDTIRSISAGAVEGVPFCGELFDWSSRMQADIYGYEFEELCSMDNVFANSHTQHPFATFGGNIIGNLLTYNVAAGAARNIPGLSQRISNLSGKLSTYPVLNRIGRDHLTNIIGGTIIETSISTVPGMVKDVWNGESADNVFRNAGLDIGRNLLFNIGGEAVSAAIGKVLTKVPEEVQRIFPKSVEENADDVAEAALKSGSNTGAGEYVAPCGGGGVTSTIKANGQTVNFGHGGRHLEGTGLNVDAVNQALANEVSTLNLGTGQFHKGQIIVDGITIEYTSYGVSEGIINVGTYYPLQ